MDYKAASGDEITIFGNWHHFLDHFFQYSCWVSGGGVKQERERDVGRLEREWEYLVCFFQNFGGWKWNPSPGRSLCCFVCVLWAAVFLPGRCNQHRSGLYYSEPLNVSSQHNVILSIPLFVVQIVLKSESQCTQGGVLPEWSTHSQEQWHHKWITLGMVTPSPPHTPPSWAEVTKRIILSHFNCIIYRSFSS